MRRIPFAQLFILLIIMIQIVIFVDGMDQKKKGQMVEKEDDTDQFHFEVIEDDTTEEKDMEKAVALSKTVYWRLMMAKWNCDQKELKKAKDIGFESEDELLQFCGQWKMMAIAANAYVKSWEKSRKGQKQGDEVGTSSLGPQKTENSLKCNFVKPNFQIENGELQMSSAMEAIKAVFRDLFLWGKGNGLNSLKTKEQLLGMVFIDYKEEYDKMQKKKDAELNEISEKMPKNIAKTKEMSAEVQKKNDKVNMKELEKLLPKDPFTAHLYKLGKSDGIFLKKVPSQKCIQECEDKLYFPYYYNKKENYGVRLQHLPPMEDYSSGSMNKEKFAKFEKWYNENNETPFYLDEELKNYCQNDTEILLLSIIEFRRILINDITKGFDPLPRSCTNAGVEMNIFMAIFLLTEQLSIVPEKGYERCDRASVAAIKYLEWRSKRDEIEIRHAGNGRELLPSTLKMVQFSTKMLTIFSLFFIKISLLDSVEAGHEVTIKAYFKDFVGEVPVYANAKANLTKCKGQKYELKGERQFKAGIFWELTFETQLILKPEELCSNYEDKEDLVLEALLSNYHKEKFPAEKANDKTPSRKNKISKAEKALDEYIKKKENEKKKWRKRGRKGNERTEGEEKNVRREGEEKN
ncbi:hypothetical protein niasHT_009097 [Heterodera trifolii]|uniref:DNA-directed DNA polymerase n=1 Tax=Heterodera trifolii TaxID=157864 RepID=A0ABD2M5K4_9BILA